MLTFVLTSEGIQRHNTICDIKAKQKIAYEKIDSVGLVRR